MSGILILAAGGHAKVVADILLASGYSVAGYLDDDSSLWGQTRLGIPILGAMAAFDSYAPDGLVIGVGDNAARREITDRLGLVASDLLINAIHPAAVVARSVTLGRGVVIAAGAIVNPDTIIADGAIVNTGASVDHDCVVGAYAHVAPGARLAGGVRVGVGALVGIGSVAIPGASIGSWSTIGAGAAVVTDIPDACTAVGVPARVIEEMPRK